MLTDMTELEYSIIKTRVNFFFFFFGHDILVCKHSFGLSRLTLVAIPLVYSMTLGVPSELLSFSCSMLWAPVVQFLPSIIAFPSREFHSKRGRPTDSDLFGLGRSLILYQYSQLVAERLVGDLVPYLLPARAAYPLLIGF